MILVFYFRSNFLTRVIRRGLKKMKVSVFNRKSIWGLVLCFLSFLSGDILHLIGFGFVFQQTAITNACGFLGLAFVILGGVEALLEAIQKKSLSYTASTGSTVAEKPFESDAADKRKEDFSKNMMEAIQKKSSPSAAKTKSKSAEKSSESEAADELDKNSSKDALAKYKALTRKG